MKTVKLENSTFFEIKLDNSTFEIDKRVYHFMKMMDIEVKNEDDLNKLINDFCEFEKLWISFKEMENKELKESKFEKTLTKQILVHTIKPKTQYAHQQEKRNGKPLLYPIFHFRNDGRLESTAPGGNYPIKECNIFVKSSEGDYVKIK